MQDNLVTAQMLVDYARSWKGVRWRDQGRNRKGIDCVGLILDGLHHFKLSTLTVTGYKRTSTTHEFQRYFDENLVQIPMVEREPGCIITFRDTITPGHTGIIALDSKAQTTFIHAYAHPWVKKVEETYLTADWVNKYVKIYRIPGVQYIYG